MIFMLGKILSHDDFHEITYDDAWNYYMAGYQPEEITLESYMTDLPQYYFNDDINDDWNFKNFYAPDEFVAQTKRYLEIIIEENTLTYFFYETADYNGLLITDGKREKYVDIADFPGDGALEDAKKWDFSEVENLKTLENVACVLSTITEHFVPGEFENLVKIKEWR